MGLSDPQHPSRHKQHTTVLFPPSTHECRTFTMQGFPRVAVFALGECRKPPSFDGCFTFSTPSYGMRMVMMRHEADLNSAFRYPLIYPHSRRLDYVSVILAPRLLKAMIASQLPARMFFHDRRMLQSSLGYGFPEPGSTDSVWIRLSLR